ncbi:unnamed protein product [[Candida] boidinii]|nr:unnamed protein product [[Candida] boidinii]
MLSSGSGSTPSTVNGQATGTGATTSGSSTAANANNADDVLLHPNLPNTVLVQSDEIKVDQDGVPEHQLIYNNEIIFNPNAGPIPGTSAWKKQKILERNRIAASKCRQKKKVLQERLQTDIENLTSENNLLKAKNQLLESKLDDIQNLLITLINGNNGNNNNTNANKKLSDDKSLIKIKQLIDSSKTDLNKQLKDKLKLSEN